jgi:hypothetical protein
MRFCILITLIAAFCIHCKAEKQVSPSVTGKAKEIIIVKNKDQINIFLKASINPEGNRYIQYTLQHVQSDAINLDEWRITVAYEVEKTGDFTFTNVYPNNNPITHKGSEWDCAIRESNTVDFIGGYHGDERMSSVKFYADGIEKDLNTAENITCADFKFSQTSTLFKCETNIPVAKHLKTYTSISNQLKTEQEIEWLEALNIETAYLTMFPIVRKMDVGKGAQLTDKASWDVDKFRTVYDVSMESFTAGIGRAIKNVRTTKILGTTTGLSAEVNSSPNPLLPNNNFRIDTRPSYNKFYFDFTGKNYLTKIGEYWKNVSTYKITTVN